MEKATGTVAARPGAISNASSGLIDGIVSKGMAMIDALFPPEKRAKWWAKFKDFAVSNPKTTAFLLSNLVLTGPPLLLFSVFTITVFVVSLIAALLVGLIAALLFTVFMLLVALFIILPTIFMTTLASSFLFLWGLGGYFLLKWFNDGEIPAAAGQAIGDAMNSLTGGRLTWLMDAARGTPLGKGEDGEEKAGSLSTEGNGLSSENMSSPTPKTKEKAAPAKSATKSAAPDPTSLT